MASNDEFQQQMFWGVRPLSWTEEQESSFKIQLTEEAKKAFFDLEYNRWNNIQKKDITTQQ